METKFKPGDKVRWNGGKGAEHQELGWFEYDDLILGKEYLVTSYEKQGKNEWLTLSGALLSHRAKHFELAEQPSVPSKEEVMEIANSGPQHKAAMKRWFPQYFKDVKVVNTRMCGEKMPFNESTAVVAHESNTNEWLVRVRYADGISLNTRDYNWEIKDDNLIPTRKD
jgi:hypothetical protein